MTTGGWSRGSSPGCTAPAATTPSSPRSVLSGAAGGRSGCPVGSRPAPPTGHHQVRFDTRSLPDGVLLKACGTQTGDPLSALCLPLPGRCLRPGGGRTPGREGGARDRRPSTRRSSSPSPPPASERSTGSDRTAPATRPASAVPTGGRSSVDGATTRRTTYSARPSAPTATTTRERCCSMPGSPSSGAGPPSTPCGPSDRCWA